MFLRQRTLFSIETDVFIKETSTSLKRSTLREFQKKGSKLTKAFGILLNPSRQVKV